MSSVRSSFSKIMITMPLSVAEKFFRESDDLPVSKFPAASELATIVGKTLYLDYDENGKNMKLEAFIKTSKKNAE